MTCGRHGEEMFDHGGEDVADGDRVPIFHKDGLPLVHTPIFPQHPGFIHRDVHIRRDWVMEGWLEEALRMAVSS